MLATSEALVILGAYALLCLLCVVLALIDLRHGIIPDRLNLAIAGLGLAQTTVAGGPAATLEAAAGGLAAGAVFWLLHRLYFFWRKADGLGLGDIKFLAAAAVWIGIAGLPMLLLISTVSALAAAGSMQLAGQQLTRRTSLPFGPFLAAGLLLTLIAQQWLGTP